MMLGIGGRWQDLGFLVFPVDDLGSIKIQPAQTGIPMTLEIDRAVLCDTEGCRLHHGYG